MFDAQRFLIEQLQNPFTVLKYTCVHVASCILGVGWGGVGIAPEITFYENLISNQIMWSMCILLSITLKEQAIQTCDVCNCWHPVGSALLERNLTTVYHICLLYLGPR